ncbi:response regulator transcription factor [Massilia sp. CFBP 13647]|nr:response regulator transcription factor [Massilia sp. CFBP 13647]MBD8673876.1 response regulator transcription factor [Massilia sp. CFBP 13721]
MKNILLVDASEEVRSMAPALEIAGYSAAHISLNRVLETVQSKRPAIMMFSVFGAQNTAGIRTLLKSEQMPGGIAAIGLTASPQLPSFDFSMGLDDFIVYPAPFDEVNARMRRAIFQKTGFQSDNKLVAGNLRINLGVHKAYIDDEPVDLTFKEYEILRFLAAHPDKVFTREALLNRIWGYEFDGGARTVDVHIRRLRAKIEHRGQTFIQTVHNVGYRFHILKQPAKAPALSRELEHC